MGIGMGFLTAEDSVYFEASKPRTLCASVRSLTGWALAAMDSPVIAMMSGVSWSMVHETRLSSARFRAF